jgi:hypothetical protein
MEKYVAQRVLKGRSFSCAVQVLYFRHGERTLVREPPALSNFP